MSGFVSVGEAGSFGNAAIVAVMVSVCCIMPETNDVLVSTNGRDRASKGVVDPERARE
jgi:hypothetical protein